MNIQFFCSYVPSRTIGRDLQHLLIPSKDLKGWRMEKQYETRFHHVSDVFHITFPCTKASRNTIRNQCKHLFPESFPWLNAYCPEGSRPKDDLCLSPCHADILLVVYGLNGWDESLNPLMWGGVLDILDFWGCQLIAPESVLFFENVKTRAVEVPLYILYTNTLPVPVDMPIKMQGKPILIYQRQSCISQL